ncbi:hypothetical protein [Methylocystis parvus]|uniref:hypothetical protein n=1 Tax=Methylocystis parvus TaxID=134 RepID=UPI003C72E282
MKAVAARGAFERILGYRDTPPALAGAAFGWLISTMKTPPPRRRESDANDDLVEATDALLVRLLQEGATAGIAAHGPALDRVVALAKMQGAGNASRLLMAVCMRALGCRS